MIICFKCSPETKGTLDTLIESGQYKDYTEVISVAVANLAILHGELADKGVVIISEEEPQTARNFSWSDKKRSMRQTKGQRSQKAVKKTASHSSDFPFKDPASIPQLFLIDDVGKTPSLFANLPNDVWMKGQEIPLDRWVFGQYNKMLPAKVNCRALMNLLVDEPKGVLLKDAATRIAEEASKLGDFLIHHDEQNGIERDDAISTAFPSNGISGDKGRLRYANHFVASVSTQGQVSGLLIDLKLINHTGGKNPRLLLTEIGWRFAIMRNPVLDSLQEQPKQKFNAEETTFLLDHIVHSIPAEDFAYHAILTAINEGMDTPDKIDAALQKYVPSNTNRSLSKSFLSSQRSGAISRMADIGLVERVRDGVRVSYTVTESGRQYVGYM